MEAETQKYRKFGMDLACVLHGSDPYELEIQKSAHEATLEDHTTKACVCKMAADMYAGCGKRDRPEFWIFKKLASAGSWPDELDTFYDSALTGIGVAVKQAEDEIAETEKQAGAKMLGGVLPGLIGKGIAVTPSMVATLAGVGAGVGAGGGAIAWKMNRDTKNDDADLESMKARIKYYNQITDEISRDLQEKGDIEEDDIDKYEQQDEEV